MMSVPSRDMSTAPGYEIEVRHTIDAGHRVVGHEGKCARLHGHTYMIHVRLVSPTLMGPGFVADFGDVKQALDEWDHRLLLWEDDPFLAYDDYALGGVGGADLEDFGVVRVPFNPTAENMARHLAERFSQLDGVTLSDVVVSETAKTHARWIAVSR